MDRSRILLKLDDESKELLERLQREQRTRTECVRQMFVEVLPNQERSDKPTVPSEAAIRLQTRIDAEEFVEKIEALYDNPTAIETLRLVLGAIAKHSSIRKDLHDRLPEFADALADCAVTNEGFAVLFGIDLEPVFQEVHAANMRKKDGPIDEHGKRLKPEGWTPPDVTGILRNQGYRPTSEMKVDEPIPYRLVPKFDECDIHGAQTSDGPCVRCENAQYNGSEIDPIGEQSETEIASMVEQFCKVKPTLQTESQQNAVPIDASIWKTDEKVEIQSALVYVGEVQKVCRAVFFGSENERRLMIEFLGNDGQFGFWERRRQDKKIHNISVDGCTLGYVQIASVEPGRVQKDGSYLLQVEFSHVSVVWEM